MVNVFIAPRRYVQGRGVLGEAGTLLKAIGKRPLLLWDDRVEDAVASALVPGLRAAGLEPLADSYCVLQRIIAVDY